MISELTRENSAIAQIHKNHFTHKRKPFHIMLENADINWMWEEKDIEEFEELFKQGWTLQQLSEHFNRPHVEIALMMIDRELENRLSV